MTKLQRYFVVSAILLKAILLYIGTFKYELFSHFKPEKFKTGSQRLLSEG